MVGLSGDYAYGLVEATLTTPIETRLACPNVRDYPMIHESSIRQRRLGGITSPVHHNNGKLWWQQLQRIHDHSKVFGSLFGGWLACGRVKHEREYVDWQNLSSIVSAAGF